MFIPTSSYWYSRTFEPKSLGEEFSILLTNSILVIIHNTEVKNCNYFLIKKKGMETLLEGPRNTLLCKHCREIRQTIYW